MVRAVVNPNRVFHRFGPSALSCPQGIIPPVGAVSEPHSRNGVRGGVVPGMNDYVLERGYAAECVTVKMVRKSYGVKLFPSLDCRKTEMVKCITIGDTFVV